MRTTFFLFRFLLEVSLFLTPYSEGVTYYVKPLFDTKCPGQPCETLQYYLDGAREDGINRKAITMVLLNGTHTVCTLNWSLHVSASVIRMIGQDSANVTVTSPDLTFIELYFSNHNNLSLQNLHAVNIVLTIIADDHFPQPSILQLYSVDLTWCKLVMMRIRAHIDRAVLYGSPIFALVGTDLVINESILLYRIYIYLSYVTFELRNCKVSQSQLVVMKSNVTFFGTNTLESNTDSALKCYHSTVTVTTLGKVILRNNTATKGAGMALYSSTLRLAPGANMTFINNTALEKGGGVYIEPSLSPFLQSIYIMKGTDKPSCFYELLDCTDSSRYYIHFANNSANFGGDDAYGSAFDGSYCQHLKSRKCNITVNGASSSTSSISSDPTRVCLCNSIGQPQCDITYMSQQASPGEEFSVNLVIVGENYGTTTGTVTVLYPVETPIPLVLKPGNQAPINSKYCTKLKYSLHSNYTNISVNFYLVAGNTNYEHLTLFKNSLITSVLLNVTLLPCPPGFFLVGEPPTCDCYRNICENNIQCTIISGTGFFSRYGSLWIGNEENKTTCNKYCPFDYCNITGNEVDLLSNSDTQCAFNRAGRLCGGCRENYSLAIGSSHCVQCPNNNNLAVFIYFAAAGFLLIVFISVLNFTVTQGMINGLIFYANVIWSYHSILLPQSNMALFFLRTFVAWLNLDFGIEFCLCSGLTAFWKTWLQFVFPFYTASLFIIGLQYSTRLSKLFGHRSVPTLATLLFLSYTKLLHTIITALGLAQFTEYPKNLTHYVWSVDGHLDYGHFPHITLLLAALACLLLLWLPYTLLLLLMQWLRKAPYFRISKQITQYKPVFDAYYAPLKDKHHYWFGVLLLIRGILLLVSSLTANLNPAFSLFLLLGISPLLLCYMNYKRVYRSKLVLILESSFLINLIMLVGGMLYLDTDSKQKVILLSVSIGIAFIKFCGIILWNAVQTGKWCRQQICQRQNNDDMGRQNVIVEQQHVVKSGGSGEDQFRDSVLEDAPFKLLLNADNESDY